MRFVDGYRVLRRSLLTGHGGGVASPTILGEGKKNPRLDLSAWVSKRVNRFLPFRQVLSQPGVGDSVDLSHSRPLSSSRRQHGSCRVVFRGSPPINSPIVGGISAPIKRQDKQNRQFLRSLVTCISQPARVSRDEPVPNYCACVKCANLPTGFFSRLLKVVLAAR